MILNFRNQCQMISNNFQKTNILKHNIFRMSGMKTYELAMEEADAKYRAGVGNLS